MKLDEEDNDYQRMLHMMKTEEAKKSPDMDKIYATVNNIEREDYIKRNPTYKPPNHENPADKDRAMVLHAFPTSMFALDLDLSDEEIATYVTVVKDNLKPSMGGSFDQTKGNLHQIDVMKPLVKKFRKAVAKIIDEEIWWEYEDFRINQMWGNSYEKNKMIPMHSHPNQHLSGVFFLESDQSQGGTIFFEPNPAKNCFDMPFRSNRASMAYAKSVTVEGHKNRMVLFPSYLGHCSEPNRSSKPRITISFNITINEPLGLKQELTYVGE